MTKLKETLLDILKEDQRLFDEQAELKENLLRELIDHYDPQLIELLLNHEITRQKFFVSAGKAMVFKGNDFKFFIDENKLDNSYTQFENKIGLKVGSRLLREYRDVVLNFPYKDCVLEGGQSTEEGTDTCFEYNKESGDYDEKKARRKEIFFNQILAKDEIDRLFEPKAFSNVRKYQKDENGSITESEEKEFTRDENGDIKDNLIIKGNNLLALHSLKEQFRGKVKLIYIDPPYNTGNDSFAYNDNFNHSSWLVFMKNRLEIARELLREDGVIWISCDDNEGGYLKILLDEIFLKENFVANFIWKHRKSSQNDIDVSLSHNYTYCFAKDRKLFKLNPLDVKTEKFSNPDGDPRGPWVADPLDAPNIRENLSYEIINPNTGEIYIPPKGRCWRFSKSKFDEAFSSNRIVFGKNGKSRPQYKRFQSEAEEKGENPFTIWDDIDPATNATKELIKMFGNKVFSTPKPETLIERIIKLSTDKCDISLDFHLGSGTTAAVAHKMNRQFIGIEQMDYIENVTVERLKKVIEGEEGGISKAVNWQGGGSFLYLELAKNNQNALEKIEAAGSYEELMTFFDEMYERYFLNYNVKIREFKEKVSQEPAFKNLALERQKQIFGKMLDLNQLYVNRSDMEDTRFHLSENDIAATHNFYGKNPTFL